MHYILMVILSVLFVCLATDSWSSFLFFYDQECARTSYRPPPWASTRLELQQRFELQLRQLRLELQLRQLRLELQLRLKLQLAMLVRAGENKSDLQYRTPM